MLLAALWVVPTFGFDCNAWKYPEPSIAKANSDTAYSQGLLWEIRNANGKRSYVFGTIHLADARIQAATAYAHSYIRRSSRFAMEVLLDHETPAVVAQAMFFQDNSTLADSLETALLETSLELLEGHGLDHDTASRLKPWAAYMTLSVPAADKGPPLDLQLLNVAIGNNAELLGIETIDEQLAIFQTLALGEQVSLLAESVCNYAENQAQIAAMVELYLAQNIRGLAQMTDQYRTEVNDKLLQRLLVDRNAIMVERIMPWLDEGDIFIAVGALHLPGPTGILRTLATKGYQVEAVFDVMD